VPGLGSVRTTSEAGAVTCFDGALKRERVSAVSVSGPRFRPCSTNAPELSVRPVFAIALDVRTKTSTAGEPSE
jgi:hypothetical protein